MLPFKVNPEMRSDSQNILQKILSLCYYDLETNKFKNIHNTPMFSVITKHYSLLKELSYKAKMYVFSTITFIDNIP